MIDKGNTTTSTSSSSSAKVNVGAGAAKSSPSKVTSSKSTSQSTSSKSSSSKVTTSKGASKASGSSSSKITPSKSKSTGKTTKSSDNSKISSHGVTKGTKLTSGKTTGTKSTSKSSSRTSSKDNYLERLDNYWNNEERSYDKTRNFHLEAREYAALATTTEEKEYWQDIANQLDYSTYSELKGKLDSTTRQEARYEKQIKDLENQSISAGDIVRFWEGDKTEEYDKAVKNAETIQGRLNSLEKAKKMNQEEKAAIQDQLSSYFMTREVYEARERLEDNNYILDPVNGEKQKKADQALLSSYNLSLLGEEKYYNTGDTISGSFKALGAKVGAGLSSTVTYVAKVTDESVKQQLDNGYLYVNGQKVNVNPAKDVNVDAALSGDKTANGMIPYIEIKSIEEGQRIGAELDKQIADQEAVIADLKQRKSGLRSTGSSVLSGAEVSGVSDSELQAELSKAEADLAILKNQRSSVSYQTKRMTGEDLTLNEMIGNMSVTELAEKADEAITDRLDAKYQREASKVRNSTGPVGKVIFDIGMTVGEMAIDTAIGAATGIDSRVIMGLRVFGESVTNARKNDADLLHQGLYGAAKAGVEIFTESIGGTFDKYLYGKGMTSGLLEKAVEKSADTAIGQWFYRSIYNGFSEAGEEGISWLLEPLSEWIINEDARGHYQLDTEEGLYSMLMGFMASAVGSAGSFVSGNYKTEYAQNAQEQIANDIVSAQKQAAVDESQYLEAKKYGTQEDVDRVISEIENRPDTRAPITKAIQKYRAGETLTRSEASMLVSAGIADKSVLKTATDNSVGKIGSGKIGIGKNRQDVIRDKRELKGAALGYGNKNNPVEATKIAKTGAATAEEIEEDRTKTLARDENENPRVTFIDEDWEPVQKSTEQKKGQTYEERKEARTKEIDSLLSQLENGELTTEARMESRDPEFASEKGQDIVRTIKEETLHEMKKATQESPIYFYSDSFTYYDKKSGTHVTVPARAAVYDGDTLYMVRQNKKGEMYLAKVDSDALRQATYIQGMITPNPKTQTSRWASTMGETTSGIGAVINAAKNLLSEHGYSTVSQSSQKPAEERVQSRGTESQGEGKKSVKPKAEVATAEQAMENIENGAANNKELADVVPYVDAAVSIGKTIANIKGNPFAKTGEANEPPLSKKVAKWLKENFGETIFCNKLKADIIIKERGIKNDISHKTGPVKTATFQAVPAVIKDGTIVSQSVNDKGDVTAVILAGKVNLDGRPVNVYCLLKPDDSGTNRFYLHEATDGKGNLFYELARKEGVTSALQDSTPANQRSAEETPSGENITQNSSNRNGESDTIEENKGEEFHERNENQAKVDVGSGAVPSGNGENGSGSGISGSSAEGTTEVETGTAEESARGSERKLTETGEQRLSDSCSRNNIDLTKAIPSESKTPALRVFEDISDGPITVVAEEHPTLDGLSDRETTADSFNIIVLLNSVTSKILGHVCAHETGHRKINYYEAKLQNNGHNTPDYRAFYSSDVVVDSALSKVFGDSSEIEEIRKEIYNQFTEIWARDYLKGYLPKGEIDKVFSDDVDEENRHQYVLDTLDLFYPDGNGSVFYNYHIGKEISLELFSRNYEGFSDLGLSEDVLEGLSDAIQQKYIDDGVFTADEVDAINNAIYALNNDGRRLYGEYFGEQEAEAKAVEESSRIAQLEDRIAQLEALIQGQQEKAEAEKSLPTATRSEEDSQFATRGQLTKGEEAVQTGVDLTHMATTNESQSRAADARIADDRDGEYRRLMDKEYFDDVDMVEAEKLLFDMIMATRDLQLGTAKRYTPEYYQELTRQYNGLYQKLFEQKSRRGQELQAHYTFSDAEKCKMNLAHAFLGYTRDGRFAGAHPDARNAHLFAIGEDFVNQIEAAETKGDLDKLIKLCQDMSKIRGIESSAGVLSTAAQAVEKKVLQSLAKRSGVKALATLAYGNVNSFATDVQNVKGWNMVKTIRILNLLSSPATWNTNIFNNIGQGLIGKTAQNTVGQLAANRFEKLTGQKVLSAAATRFNRSDSREIHNAKMEALEMGALMQYYGINLENGRLEMDTQGTFVADANPFEATMSAYKFIIGMGVEVSDQVKSAGLYKAMELGIEKDYAAGKIDEKTREAMLAEAKHEVNKLLYKDDNKTTALVSHFKNWLNDKAHWGNDATGTIGLGDLALAFARVPTNVVRTRLAMTPYGALFYTGQYIKGVTKAKTMHTEVVARQLAETSVDKMSDEGKWNAAKEQCSGKTWRTLSSIRAAYPTITFENAVERAGFSNAKEMTQFEMAQISRNLGKAAASAGMVMLGASLRAIGAIRDFDDEPDEEKKRLMQQKGYSGLMFNFDAIWRDGHEWKDGDTIIGGDWLEVIAMPLAIGAACWEGARSDKYETAGDYAMMVANASLTHIFDALEDLPGMADAMNLYDSISNSWGQADKNVVQKIGDNLMMYAANQLPGFFMPNVVSQAAAGVDNTVRNPYAADTTWEKSLNIVENKIPVLRQKVPESKDLWGDTRTYGESTAWGVINKVFLPGDVRTYHENEYETELFRLSTTTGKSSLPKYSVSSSFEAWTDDEESSKETVKLSASEQNQYRQLRAEEYTASVKIFLDSDEYNTLTDEQRASVLHSLATDADRVAKNAILNEKETGYHVSLDKWETELESTSERIEYLTAKEHVKAMWDDSTNSCTDNEAMDDFLKDEYAGLSDKQKELLGNKYSYLDNMYDASQHGIDSEMWETAHDVYKYYDTKIKADKTDDEKVNLKEESSMWADMEEATGATDKQMTYFEDNMKLWSQFTPKADTYFELTDNAGLSRKEASDMITTLNDLKPMDGYEGVQANQKYMAIAKSDLSPKKKWAAFWEIVPSNASKKNINKMRTLQANGYSLEQALKQVGWSKIQTRELQSNGKYKYTVVSE